MKQKRFCLLVERNETNSVEGTILTCGNLLKVFDIKRKWNIRYAIHQNSTRLFEMYDFHLSESIPLLLQMRLSRDLPYTFYTHSGEKQPDYSDKILQAKA